MIFQANPQPLLSGSRHYCFNLLTLNDLTFTFVSHIKSVVDLFEVFS